MPIYGALGLPENDRSLVNNIGEGVVYTAAQAFIQRHNADMEQAYNMFVEGTTENNKDYYKLPGGGRLQRLGNRSRAAATKAGGRWDVAFPLENFGAAFEFSKVDMAYMTVEQFANELATIRTQDVSTIRHEILLRLMNNEVRSFVDEIPHNPGTLSIQPLANGDSVIYPPVIGAASDAGATEDHYLVSGYLATAIDDDNNPLPVIRGELEEHFGTPTGYGNVCVFINTAQVAVVKALLDFTDVTDIGITPGDDTATVNSAPMGPGRLIGRCDGVWVFEWRHIPAGYMLGVDADQPGPVKIRVHPTGINLAQGLALVTEDERHPIMARNYEHWMGVGAGNRLNGVVMELKASGNYAAPSLYASY
ncbi:MAG: hypothetical protein ACFE0Q_20840 [Anaerolineae bacterium]